MAPVLATLTVQLNNIWSKTASLTSTEWAVDVRRLPENVNLTLKILPLTEKDKSKIFMEFDMPTGIYEPDVKVIFDNIVYV